ncbi:MFS transporter [Bifidobacterium stellenboschense]|uniref:Sugar transporter n=1 Tax=Bifidobacterium stellenboschense TaxID=762211 RepID=A0A087DFL9_9BIFI|nr:MFS transporter [Bifidobacterium stellenboschense]KFI94319.1 sugar transporter [Bifidobacterium stellenboschense]
MSQQEQQGTQSTAPQERGGKNKLGRYFGLTAASGLGSILGSGIISSLATTLSLWQAGLGIDPAQVGVLSGALTLAIAGGSLAGGAVAGALGMVTVFNWINAVYAIGALLCVFAQNYAMLLAGVIIAGVASGIELPVTLSVLSHDAPDNETQSQMVSYTQMFWMIGIGLSALVGFATSAMVPPNNARVQFAILAAIAVVAWAWRLLSPKFRTLHREGDEMSARKTASTNDGTKAKVNILSVFRGVQNRKYVLFLVTIFLFYALWNLLANTWGQFQTYMLVSSGASQTLATGAGLVLTVVAIVFSPIFIKVVSGKWRTVGYIIGAALQIAALVLMAAGGGVLWLIVAGLLLNNLGSPLAGEMLYKVWTQESFPEEVRTSIQGVTNGVSRLLCALFAMVTPMLVQPERLVGTLWCFVVVMCVSMALGGAVIMLQRKYGIER